MAEYEKALNELKLRAEKTASMRRGRSYRARLFFSRFRRQMLQGDRSARKDFVSFVGSKLGKSSANYNALPMSAFDPTFGEESKIANELISLYFSRVHNRQILVFSRLHYYASGGGQRGAQLAKTFKKLGFDVLYLYGEDNYYTVDKDFIEEVDLHLPIKYFNPETLSEKLSSDAFAIFEHPDARFLPFLHAFKAKGIATVYEHIDNWETELGSEWYIRSAYLEFVKSADILIGTARNLCEIVEHDSGREVLYNANAVDDALFDHTLSYDRPNDMPVGKKVLLYYGHLSGTWIDWDLLFNTARLCPDCSFAIIGYGKTSAVKEAPSNVYFLGAKQQRDLPAYLASCDFAVLHFKTCEVGSYVSPLKVFEYLAMHKRVLASPLPDIEGYPNVICSNDPNVWANTIKNPPSEKPYDVFIDSNSWKARCSDILKEVNTK